MSWSKFDASSRPSSLIMPTSDAPASSAPSEKSFTNSLTHEETAALIAQHTEALRFLRELRPQLDRLEADPDVCQDVQVNNVYLISYRLIRRQPSWRSMWWSLKPLCTSRRENTMIYSKTTKV